MKYLRILPLLCILVSCVDEPIPNDSLQSKQQKALTVKTDGAMVINPLKVNLTNVEKEFHKKILRLSGDEFENKLRTLSDKELGEFSVSFLIEDSKKLLLENGYSQKLINSEFKGDKIDLIHQALKIYGQKINSNQ